MRGTRWLILVAIAAILGGVGLTYRLQKSALERQAPARPKALPLDLNSSAEDWVWTQSMPGEGRPAVEVRARRVGQSKDNSRIDLEQVELHIFHQQGGEFDRVKSAKAQFYTAEKRLFSEGEVEITLGTPAAGQPRRNLVSIRSSGVNFDSSTGKATTDRAAEFTFENGTGKSVGASYDPNAKELRMNSQVEVNWKAAGPHAKSMKLETGDLTYKEADAKIWLLPWARLTRGDAVIDSGPAVVTLVDGDIRKIETVRAHGTDRYPGRLLEYSAAELWTDLSDSGAVTKIIGQSGARVVSTSNGAATTVTAGRVDLDFNEVDGESTLARALALGNGVVESKPLPEAGRPLPETRVLRSQTIEVKMRAGGREIDTVETQAPGDLEFLPNQPVQRHRTLKGERLWMTYGPRNQLQSFRSVSVETRTDPTDEERKRNRAPAITRSHDIQAGFSPQTGQLTRIEQSGDFYYEEADRKARADRATLDQPANTVLLDAHARMWDTTGSTSADRILLDERSGNFTAIGRVNSSRLPDRRKPGSEMLSGDEPLEAMAGQMTSANGNRHIVYQGGVVLWQGANRIQADRVEIDREKRRLMAVGNVTTQFLEQPGEGKGASKTGGAREKTPPAAPVFTIVRAARLVYTEADRLAHYTGGAVMTRPGLLVKGAEIRAYLAEQGADSRVERAYADGRVEIAQAAPDRTRTGTGEHAEYYSGEQKIVIRGGEPQLADSLRGNVRGAELTYFANDDRLLVNGAPGRPATSRIRRK